MTASGVTQISKSYLLNLQANLNVILAEVNDQITGVGPKGAFTGMTDSFIPPVSNLLIFAGPNTFQAGNHLNAMVVAMGNSVATELTWLQKTLQDMIAEISTTISTFTGTEDLNKETVDQLITDFQGVITQFGGNSGLTPGP